ncbi:MAG: hypothetical protein ACI828_000614 [Flavobacteriales bacterium]|jgi:hypothetical protein
MELLTTVLVSLTCITELIFIDLFILSFIDLFLTDVSSGTLRIEHIITQFVITMRTTETTITEDIETGMQMLVETTGNVQIQEELLIIMEDAIM